MLKTKHPRTENLHSFSLRMSADGRADGDDWERVEGVPSLSDPFIQKYLSGRDALVQQEKKQRSGR